MKKVISLILVLCMCLSMVLTLASCADSGAPDAFVIMSEELDGLFNPFFSTTGADNTIVAMTQISMLTSKYENGEVVVGYGEDEAVVTLDFESVYNKKKDQTVFTFVIKNGVKFSDGHPLTIEDVLFNLYVYLDPVYTGSATMYSTDIVGLTAYRTQTVGAGSSSSNDDRISSLANDRASSRVKELLNLFNSLRKKNRNTPVSYEDMKAAILAHSLSSGYKNAVSNTPESVKVDQLLADYDLTLKKFREELESDYVSSQESFTESPYKERKEFLDPIFCYMFAEGYVDVEYYKDPVTNKEDRSRIIKLTKNYNDALLTTKEAAISFVYEDKISNELNIILTYWATAQELMTEYAAQAKEVILHANIKDGDLRVDSISGIVSLGHSKTTAGTTVTVNGTDYLVADKHNDDGTPTQPETVTDADGKPVEQPEAFDVLQITIDGVDPKAVWNFAFTVAPQHYYGEGSKVGVDVASNKFGVEYGSFDFMTKIVQSNRNISVPMGAGAYKATNRANADNPDGNEFYSDNVVYFKANEYFETVGEGLNNAKIEKIRYQVVSSNNALSALESGSVHYVSPQLTQDNYKKIDALEAVGMNSLLAKQLGYGYIGVNASKITDINLRRAILSAMNTASAIAYYRAGTAEQIYWPMSTVSWAYPRDDSGKLSQDNGRDYPQIGLFDKEVAREKILEYMAAAGVSEGDSQLDITFTIAGSNLQEHPAYVTFRDAAALLNELGWEVEVVPDTQALTKLSTGSLEVWAAAWGSTIDPDLYQVYHKNSTATSTLAWGYPSIKNSSTRRQEQKILDELSELIDDARSTTDKEERIELYEEAMGKILDLAIELPIYQRSTVYVYNANIIDPASLPTNEEMNPYTSPLDRIWEVDFVR
ncbi:MAG: hypothetical protein IJD51_00515 [Clostridia bacterium]|nr:hypothetical protein [Clostridia bacterium]